jgi:hypothetical protein
VCGLRGSEGRSGSERAATAQSGRSCSRHCRPPPLLRISIDVVVHSRHTALHLLLALLVAVRAAERADNTARVCGVGAAAKGGGCSCL